MNAIRPWLIFLALLPLATAVADGAKRPASSKPAATGRAVITGSLIPERTNGPSRRPNFTRPTGPVIILTSEDIQRIGARDLADALRRGIAISH
jgi:hypothetical protein